MLKRIVGGIKANSGLVKKTLLLLGVGAGVAAAFAVVKNNDEEIIEAELVADEIIEEQQTLEIE